MRAPLAASPLGELGRAGGAQRTPGPSEEGAGTALDFRPVPRWVRWGTPPCSAALRNRRDFHPPLRLRPPATPRRRFSLRELSRFP